MAKKKRKTREEKIISQLRRELQETRKNLKGFQEKKQPEVKIKTKKFKTQTTNLKPLASNLYLKKDLTKSLSLAILAIGFECLVYFLKDTINFLP